MGRPLLLVVSAALAWGATMAMEVEDSMNVNPYEGTDHKSSGLLFYGDERDGCRSLAQRCYDCIDNVEQFKEIIYEYALWIYSVPRWIILRRRGVSTLPRDHSQGLLAQRADWWDIYDRWGRKGYVRRAAEITAGKVAYHAGVVTTALMPGPLCEQVGEGPPGCAVALSFAGIVAHFSGLITLPLGGLNMPACHWGFYVIMAAALGLYAYVNGWTPSRNKLGLFVLNMVTRIYLAYFMAIVVADFEFLQTHSTFVIPANLKQTSFYNDDGNADVSPPSPSDGAELTAPHFEGANDCGLMDEDDFPDDPPERPIGYNVQSMLTGAPTANSCFRDRWERTFTESILNVISAALVSGVFAGAYAATYTDEYASLSRAFTSASWAGVTTWLPLVLFTHQGLTALVNTNFAKIKKLMDGGGLAALLAGREVKNPIFVVRCRCPRWEHLEHPMIFLKDICPVFQVVFPTSLLLTAASFLFALSLPLGRLCCYWYAMRWEWDGSLPPGLVFGPSGAAAGRRFGPGFAMTAPASKHIIGWLWQFWHWMMCDWPSLGLGMPFCVAIYDRIGDTAHLVPQSVALRPGSTRIKVPDWPSTIKVYDANDDAYRDDPDPAALNIQALNIIVPTPAGVVAALRDLL